jgi:hypothetical protein
MNRKYLILITILLSINFSLTLSQDWRDKTGKDNLNFYDIQKSFNEYWSGKNINKSTPKNEMGGWKAFKRWEWYWQQRVGPSGKFPQANQLVKESNIWKNKKEDGIGLQDANSWTNLGPETSPGGYAGLGRINWVEEDPNYNGTSNKTIWIGSPGGGLWKTTDDGLTWASKFSGFTSLGVSSMVIKPDNSSILYIATGDGDASDTYSVGVLKSTDGGETWNTTGLNWALTSTRIIRKIVMSSSDYNVLFAATSDGIYRTTNGGTNWTQVKTGLYYDIEYKPGSSTVLYASGNYDISRTTDGGSNWTQLTNGLPSSSIRRIELAVSPNNSEYIYALFGYSGGNNSSGFYGLYRSTDSGDSWTAQYKYDGGGKNLLGWNADGGDTGGQAWYDLVLTVNPTNISEVYVGGVNIWKTTNSGTDWTIVAHWTGSGGAQAVHADHHHLSFAKTTNRLYNGNDGGIYRSTNGGTNWSWLGSGLKITQLYRLGASASNASRIISGAQDNGTKLLKSGTWTDVIGGDGMECLIDHSNADIMYGSLYYGEVRKSTNGGNSFSGMSLPTGENAGWVTPFVMHPTDPNTIFMGYTNVWKTTNAGGSWSKISTWGTNTLSVLHVAPSNPNYIYAGFGNTLKYTSNGGTSWNSITLPVTEYLPYLAINDTDPQRIYAAFSGYSSGNKVFYSTNAGTTWTNLSGSLPNVPINTIVYQRNLNNKIFVGTDIGVFWRDDNNTSWQDFNSGLPDVEITELEIHYGTSHLRAATYGRGVWDIEIPPSNEVSTPFQLLPENSSMGIAFDSKIIWNKVPAATSYSLQVSLNSNMSNPIFSSTSLTDTTYTIKDTLFNFSTTYYWRVNAKKDAMTSNWSQIWSFRTKTNLAAPTLTSPANNATNIKLTDTLKWNAVSNAQSYIINIATDANFASIIGTDTTTSLFSWLGKQALKLNTNYYWRVVGVLSGDLGEWSSVFKLTTRTLNHIYCIPTTTNCDEQISKVEFNTINKSTECNFYSDYSDFSTTITKGTSYQLKVTNNLPYNGDMCGVWFDWNQDGDFNDEGENYSLSTSNFSVFTTNILVPATALKGKTMMRIRVVWNQTLTPCGTSEWGEVEDYSVYLTAAPLNPPLLSLPANNATNQNTSLTLSWQDVANATSYSVMASKLQDFSTNILNTDAAVTTQNLLNLDSWTNYYWRVKSNNADTSSVWSSEFKFKTLEPTLTLLSPANNAVNVKKGSMLIWKKLNNATKYQLQVAKANNFNPMYASLFTVDTSFVVGIYNSVNYFWRVRGIFGTDTTSWSSVFNFTVKDSLPVPQHVSPANNSSTDNLTFNIDWNNVTGTDKYRIQVSELANFSTTVYDNWVSLSELSSSSIPLSRNKTYFWHVLAADFADTTAFSSTWNFTINPVLATLTTNNVSNISSSSATSGGNITDDGGATITERGICWSLNQNPTTNDNKLSNGTGTGSYSVVMSNLDVNQTYFVRAYAINSKGTAYGVEKSFTTLADFPTLTTNNITSITAETASSGGNVLTSGGLTVTTRGVCWSTTQNPTIDNDKTTNGSGLGTFTSNLSGLSPNTTYFVRAYATNSFGTGYGTQKSFTTSATIPTLTTTNISGVTANSANSGGDVTNDGGASITARGVCWATTQNPTISNSKTSNGTGTGTFTSNITGLNPNVTYFVRAYATNSAGTNYGEQKSFTTLIDLPTVVTNNITSITSNSSVSGGLVSNSGGGTVTARGVCWSLSQNPTISNDKTTDGSGLGSFTSNLSNLNPNTTYFVRAYATNSTGTNYGEQKSFTTTASLATLTTTDISAITVNSANSGGNISSNGGANITARGVCWSTTQNPTINNTKTSNGTGNGIFTSNITGLNPNVTYFVRAYATNSVGTAYGEQKSFTTLIDLPTIITSNISSITNNSAASGGFVSNSGGGTVTARGICWSTSQNPTINDVITSDGTGLGTYSSNLSNLTANTTYFVRAYATNSAGTNYGEQKSFTTSSSIPTVATTDITNITVNDAKSGGNISSDGGASVTARGVCWSTSQNPTINDNKSSDGTGTGSYISTINGLVASTTYFVRAYATNSNGTAYGEEKSFNTSATIPTLTTSDISSITANSANSGGNISSDGGAAVTERGVCWSTSQNPTTANSKTSNGTGTGSFVSNITNLLPNTTYFVRAFAINSVGTAYGTEKSFTTSVAIATLTTTDISAITSNSANSGGNITNDGGASVTERGVCWSTSQNPTTANSKTSNGTGTGSFVSNITNLLPNTTYFVRAFAVNSAGTAYGNEKSFTTSPALATLSTTHISAITSNSANSGGNITNDGGASVTERGVCWSTSQNPTTANSKTSNGTGTGSFVSNIANLLPNTTYFVRAFAINSAGTAYGTEKSFKTSPALATLTTTDISAITSNSAHSGGNVTNDGGASVTERGVCWSTSQNPTTDDSKTSNGTGTGSFVSNIANLLPNTTYFVRAYAINLVGTSYGDQKPFTTNPALATLTTTDISAVTSNSANSGGNVTNDGGASVTERGICWSTSQNPTTADSKISNGTGTGSFVSNISNLLPNTTYFVRAYAVNSVGTAYGEQKSFVTSAALATLTTTDISAITSNSANSGGNITNDGGGSVSSRGVCWSTSQNPTTADSKTSNGTGTGSFVSNLTGLNPNTTYFVRAYAVNSAGTAYGLQKSFTTNTALPTLTTTDISGITAIAANSGGNISSDGGVAVTSRGVCWSTSQNPTTTDSKTSNGTGSGAFTSNITGLNPNTTYFVRAYAVNSVGTAYGLQKSFTTNAKSAVPNTWNFTDLTGNSSTVQLPTSTNPKISGRDFVTGDALGFFFTNNNQLVCAGFGVWDGNNLSVTVWGDNSGTPTKDGFIFNEQYTLKVWDCLSAKEYSATATYSQGNSFYSINGLSVIGALNVITNVTHEISLNSGWNLISTNVEPNNKSMPVVWNDIKSFVNLVKNNGGASYIPNFNINQIGNWDKNEAYQVSMNQSKILSITGTSITPENTPISLTSGWKMVAYLRNSSMNISTALATLTSANALTLVKNSAGASYIPQFNINQIGNMIPGQGYQMFLSKNATLTYPANALGRTSAGNSATPTPVNLIPEKTHTGTNFTMIVSADVEDKNEIGIYNSSNKLIGSGIFINKTAAVTIWGDDIYTELKDGAAENEKLSAKYYDKEKRTLNELHLTDLVDVINDKPVHELYYQKDAFIVSKAVVNNSENDIYNIKLHPNPMRDNLSIEFNLQKQSNVSCKIYNLEGILISNIYDGVSQSGICKLNWNSGILASGEYNIIITINGENFARKVMITK